MTGLAFVRAQDAQEMAAAESPESYASGQPIAFPHNTHAGTEPGQMGMDCQYCHFSAERSVDAGIPPVSLCVGCHQVIPGATVLAYANANHWSVAIPVSDTHPVIASTIITRNAYPRIAMLEAALRYVVEQLPRAPGEQGAAAPTSQTR